MVRMPVNIIGLWRGYKPNIDGGISCLVMLWYDLVSHDNVLVTGDRDREICVEVVSGELVLGMCLEAVLPKHPRVEMDVVGLRPEEPSSMLHVRVDVVYVAIDVPQPLKEELRRFARITKA